MFSKIWWQDNLATIGLNHSGKDKEEQCFHYNVVILN